MYEVNLFQFLVWLVLIALNVFFIWKYININKVLKTQSYTIESVPNHYEVVKKVEEIKKVENSALNFDINELSEIIEDIKKEEELTKNDCIQRLIYYAKYVVDPLNKEPKVIKPDYNLEPKRIKKHIKEGLLNLFPDLTEQEILLCTYIVNGISTAEICLLLKLSNGTVRVYKNKLKTKLNVPKGLSLGKYLDSVLEVD